MVPITYPPVQGDMALVEEKLHGLDSEEFPWLADLLRLVLKNSGKRLRPALTLLAGRFYHYDSALLIPIAAATELLHTATLVHDDTIDGSLVRRGSATINAIWSNATAILLGDYIFASAADLVASTGNVEVSRLFARTLMTMINGELNQNRAAFNWRQGREQYLRRIGDKTASLFAMATEAGGIISGAPPEQLDALRGYGHQLGMAFQLVDDILDFMGEEAELGKPVGSDLLGGTLTLPALVLNERYGENSPVRVYCEGPEDKAYFQRTLEMVRSSGVVEECYQVASDYRDRALAHLPSLPAGEARDTLEQVAYYVVERRA